MEDEHTAIPSIPQSSNKPGAHGFFAVYDGHGGSRAAEFVAQNLHEYIFNNDSFVEDPKAAMYDGIARIEKEFLEQAVKSELADGTTATVALVHGQHLIVANVGDSEAVLCRGTQAIPLSPIHNVKDNPDEAKRVQEEGGLIFKNRVGHPSLNAAYFSIGVSRAIGDLMFKHSSYTEGKPSGITALPEFKEVPLVQDDRFMILACDGLWGVITHQQAVDFVSEQLSKSSDLDAVSEALALKAYEEGSSDNITAMVVMLVQKED